MTYAALLEGQSPIPKKPDTSEQERLDAIKKEQEEAAKMKQVLLIIRTK